MPKPLGACNTGKARKCRKFAAGVWAMSPGVSGDMSKSRQPARLLRSFAFGFVALRCGRTEHHNQQDQRKYEPHDRTLPNQLIMRLHALTRGEAAIH